jgi:Holliday junction resolvase
MRYAAKVDINQKEIVASARACGAAVYHTHTIGKGFPDLLVCYGGYNLLVEIKKDKKAKLTQDQVEFHVKHPGQIHVITSSDEMIELLNGMKKGNG